jgi:hypothetical protein
MTFRVDSEVGLLRRAIVHRPGLELNRLTPSNIEGLLFDDVMWAKKAREEHDAFAQALRDKAVRSTTTANFWPRRSTSPRAGSSCSTVSARPRTSDPLWSIPCAHSSSTRRGGAGRVPGWRSPQGRSAPGWSAQPEVGHAPIRRLRACAAAKPPVPARQQLLDLRRV